MKACARTSNNFLFFLHFLIAVEFFLFGGMAQAARHGDTPLSNAAKFADVERAAFLVKVAQTWKPGTDMEMLRHFTTSPSTTLIHVHTEGINMMN
jgi:hypothetical protein